MNQKAVIKLETEKNERSYEFIMEIGSPYGEAYDAAFEFLNHILEMSKDAANKADRNQEVEIKTDDDKEEIEKGN